MRYEKFVYVQNPLLWTVLKYAPRQKMQIFYLYDRHPTPQF